MTFPPDRTLVSLYPCSKTFRISVLSLGRHVSWGILAVVSNYSSFSVFCPCQVPSVSTKLENFRFLSTSHFPIYILFKHCFPPLHASPPTESYSYMNVHLKKSSGNNNNTYSYVNSFDPHTTLHVISSINLPLTDEKKWDTKRSSLSQKNVTNERDETGFKSSQPGSGVHIPIDEFQYSPKWNLGVWNISS